MQVTEFLKPFSFEKLEVLGCLRFIEGQNFHLIEQKWKLEPIDLSRIIVIGGLDVVMHSCHPLLGKLRQKDAKFETSLDCLVKLS